MGRDTVQLRQRGVLTLPAKLRDKYRLEDGDVLTVVDLDGALVLSPRVSVIPKLVGEIERSRAEAGVSVEDLVAGVSRQRRVARRGRPAAASRRRVSARS